MRCAIARARTFCGPVGHGALCQRRHSRLQLHAARRRAAQRRRRHLRRAAQRWRSAVRHCGTRRAGSAARRRRGSRHARGAGRRTPLRRGRRRVRDAPPRGRRRSRRLGARPPAPRAPGCTGAGVIRLSAKACVRSRARAMACTAPGAHSSARSTLAIGVTTNGASESPSSHMPCRAESGVTATSARRRPRRAPAAGPPPRRRARRPQCRGNLPAGG